MAEAFDALMYTGSLIIIDSNLVKAVNINTVKPVWGVRKLLTNVIFHILKQDDKCRQSNPQRQFEKLHTLEVDQHSVHTFQFLLGRTNLKRILA